jgi:hypothetical protein
VSILINAHFQATSRGFLRSWSALYTPGLNGLHHTILIGAHAMSPGSAIWWAIWFAAMSDHAARITSPGFAILVGHLVFCHIRLCGPCHFARLHHLLGHLVATTSDCPPPTASCGSRGSSTGSSGSSSSHSVSSRRQQWQQQHQQQLRARDLGYALAARAMHLQLQPAAAAVAAQAAAAVSSRSISSKQ